MYNINRRFEPSIKQSIKQFTAHLREPSNRACSKLRLRRFFYFEVIMKAQRDVPPPIPKKKRYTDYAEYLKSDEYLKITQEFMANYRWPPCKCSLCQKRGKLLFHHWRYEKDWCDDSYKNLIMVCDGCHDLIHSTDLEHDSTTYSKDEVYYYLLKLMNRIVIIMQSERWKLISLMSMKRQNMV